MSLEVSFLLLVVSGNNTEKNMEAYDQMIKDTKKWLGEVDKLVSEVAQQQLIRLELRNEPSGILSDYKTKQTRIPVMRPTKWYA